MYYATMYGSFTNGLRQFLGEIGVADDIKKVRSMSGKRLLMRTKLWPEVDESSLWLRKDKVGFTTIPRTMTLIGRIMDQISGKGVPLFSTYLPLWCRVFDEAFVEIRNERELAFEAGFSGSRGVATWRARMRRLQELGFIGIRSGIASDFQYVLILDPLLIIAGHAAAGAVDSLSHQSLTARLIEIGAAEGD